MDLARLDVLKEKLTSSKDFGAIAEYFFDHFAEDDAFFDVGKPTKHAVLEACIPAVARKMCGDKLVISHMLLVGIPNTHFIHGGCMINGRLANVFYFDDIQVGLIALTPAKPGGDTLFSRFSGQMLPPEAVMSKN